MKKFLRPMMSVMTSVAVLTATTAFSVCSYDDIETGIVDMSGEQFVLGESDDFLLSFTGSAVILSDGDTSDGWVLGDYLDANNKAVYAKLAELVTPSLDDITVVLPEPVQFTTSSVLTSSDTVLYDAVFGACSSAICAVSFDMPEIFWLNQNDIAVSPNNIPYTYNRFTKTYTYTLKSLTLSPSCYSSFADLNEIIEYKGILEKAVDDFVVEGDTTVQKLKSIHDQIDAFTCYDMSAPFASSALGSLVTAGSVCESYAKGFKMICDRENIPCLCVFGNYNSEDSTAHMWNYVLMEDNCWYAVDTTWDDKDGKNGVDFVDTYFMKGSADFNRNHTPCESYSTVVLKYPELAEWNYGENPAFTTTVPATTTTATTTTTASTTKATTTTTSTTKATTTTTSTTKATTTTTSTTKATTTTTSTTKATTTTTSTTKATTTTTSTTKATTTTTSTTKATTATTSTTKATTATTSTTTATTTTTSTTTVTTTAKAEFEYGDLNHDGKVSIADLVYCSYHVLGIEPAQYSCDLNGDNRIDVYDVIIMRQIIDKVIAERFTYLK